MKNFIITIILLFRIFKCIAQTEEVQNRPLGLIPPTAEDLNKIPFAARGTVTVKLPDSIDISREMPIPGDQGKVQGACVGWATSYAIVSYKEKIKKKLSSYYEEDPDIKNHRTFSPAFIFNTVCQKLQIGNCWQGIKFVDALQVLQDVGAVPIGKFPYDKDRADGCLAPNPLLDGELAKIASEYKLSATGVQVNETTLKEYIFLRQPVLVGVTVDPFFELSGRTAFNKKERFLWDPADEAIGPYHAMVMVGFDEKSRLFKLMNSFGTSWGNQGFLEVPYEKLIPRLREAYVLESYLPQTTSSQIKPSKLTNAKIETTDGFVGSLRSETYKDFGPVRVSLRFISEERDVIGVSFQNLVTNQNSPILLIYANEEKNFNLGNQNLSFQFISAESPSTPNPRAFFSLKNVEGIPAFATSIIGKLEKDQEKRQKNIDVATKQLEVLQGQAREIKQ